MVDYGLADQISAQARRVEDCMDQQGVARCSDCLRVNFCDKIETYNRLITTWRQHLAAEQAALEEELRSQRASESGGNADGDP